MHHFKHIVAAAAHAAAGASPPTSGITVSPARLVISLLTMVCALAANAAPPQPSAGIESAIELVRRALPSGWRVAHRSEGEFPYGHHYCGKYTGIRGAMLTLVGPRPVAVHWTTESGEARQSNAAVEAIDLWFMPPGYRDSAFAWLCFHRPVQPVEVLVTDSVRVYGRTTHRLEPRDVFLREVLPRASSIQWPESPATDPARISWPGWAQQVAAAVAGATQGQ